MRKRRKSGSKKANILVAGVCLLCFSPIFALAYTGNDAAPSRSGAQTDGVAAVLKAVRRAPAPNPVEISRHPLLERFPPEEGWSAKRRETILVKTIGGEFPGGEERAFYMNFKEWKAALDAEKAAE